MTTTTTIIIRDIDKADALDALRDSLTKDGFIFDVVEEAAPGSAAPTYDPNAFRFEEIAHRAERLYVAVMEREQLTNETETNKLEALGCFWLAANFQNVSDALAHSYGNEPFPVGQSFDDFVKAFLGEEAYEQL
jgi:hypothetical protein